MNIQQLADMYVEISSTSNGQPGFQLGNGDYVQFKLNNGPSFADLGNDAFSKAFNSEELEQFVDVEVATEEFPLVATSTQVYRAMQSEINQNQAVRIVFLISNAVGMNGNTPITNAFTLAQHGSSGIKYAFTDGGTWPT